MLKLLIVEDAATIRRRLQRLFADIPGVQVVGDVACVDEAIRAIHALHPDLITLDIALQGESGFEVLQYLHDAGQTARVFVVSNHDSSAFSRRATELGARGFFSKNRDMNALVEAIGSLAGEVRPARAATRATGTRKKHS